jgi:hypothetical protein
MVVIYSYSQFDSVDVIYNEIVAYLECSHTPFIFGKVITYHLRSQHCFQLNLNAYLDFRLRFL